MMMVYIQIMDGVNQEKKDVGVSVAVGGVRMPSDLLHSSSKVQKGTLTIRRIFLNL